MAAILIVLSYLIGSIPSAYIAGRLLKGIDIRKAGDGNVGAANAYRQIGPVTGWVVLVADVCKGALAVVMAQAFGSQFIALLAGLAAVAGHTWPLYIGFKGGRGEATVGGVLVVLLPQPVLILLAVSIVPFLVTRNTILLGAILFAPLWLVALLMGAPGALVIYSVALPSLVGLMHLLTTRRLPVNVRQGGKYMR